MKESKIKVREMPESIYCGTIKTPYIDVELYFPKDIKNRFTDKYKKEEDKGENDG